MKTPTIYDIKRLTSETAPHYFSRSAMKFFGQTLKDFRVHKMDDGRFRISAKSKFGSVHSTRYFNPQNNKLELS